MSLPLRAFAAAGLAWLCLGVAGDAWAVEGDVTGWWLDESKAGGILIEPCGENMCGKLGWMLHPLTDKGQPKIDTKNPDAKLHGRSFCNMQIMGGFVKSGPGEWEDGWIYNPDDGETYQSHFALLADGTLRLRGFIGISLLGQSQIWTRPTQPVTPCTPPT
jgi:uncharacterized protein (DUF2147 family)